MATSRRAWTTERTWTIKGVSDRTRDAVVERTHDAGLTIGEWVDQALARAAEEARNPRPPAATREDVAAVVREELAPLLERLAALETKLSRKTRPAPTREEPVPPAPVGAREGDEWEARGRRLPEHVRERIAELHRAGHSVYAISKELGVSYNAVRARVTALARESEPSTLG